MPSDQNIELISRTTVAIRRSFVERTETGDPSPLQALLSGTAGAGGGAGGRLRIALLMSLLWVVASPPHTTQRVASYWAQVLGLADPMGTGARSVRDTLGALEERHFVSLTRIPPDKTEIVLRSENGDGRPYAFPNPREGEDYFRVPRAFWSDRLVSQLSGRALAVYLVVLANADWRSEREFWISRELFHERYGLGDTTRKRGFKELVDRGILDVTERSVTSQSGSRTFRRNIYTLNPRYSGIAWDDE